MRLAIDSTHRKKSNEVIFNILYSMNWFFKAQVFNFLSIAPAGRKGYRFLQDHLTKTLIATQERVLQKMDVGITYWNKFGMLGETPENLRTHLDLGSGWHPTIPLLFEGFGVTRQILCDVAPVMTSDSFASTLAMFRSVIDRGLRLGCQYPKDDADSLTIPKDDVLEMIKRHGFSYHAPYFGIGDRIRGEVDFITSTQVLLYIEMPQLVECFQDLFKALRPGGWFLATNHLYDLYSDADKSISIYNNLKYSRRFWNSMVNSGMMSFNRLKSRDYREALEIAGFEIIEFMIDHGGEDDLRSLRSLKIHPEFTVRYSEQELSEKHLFFVVRKP